MLACMFELDRVCVCACVFSGVYTNTHSGTQLQSDSTGKG